MISSSFPHDLYPRLLGESWHSLAEEVRSAHTVGTIKCGRLTVAHGGSFIARMLNRFSPLPRNSGSTEVTLDIQPHRDGERWKRCFGPDEFTTFQRASAGHLVERFGHWDLCFSLSVADAALVYDQRAAYFILGRLRIPIPRAFAPCVRARESAHGSGQVHVHVVISLPCIGPLLSYDGHLEVNSQKP